MKFLLALLTIVTLSLSEDIYEDDISAPDALSLAKSGEAIIVDVRTPIEFLYVGHGEGFINIPYLDWTYEPKSIKTRVKSAMIELKTDKIKKHKDVQKLYNPKERENKKFVSEIMEAMKLSKATKVILVCRSGPRSKAAANALTKEGIEAYNLDEGFIYGWKVKSDAWGGQWGGQ
ncbi:MAG: rhodanese-like domain-containing protein [Campylobacterota bacterium]|nr:rhodanese-like domain-containing protein [Campylobacterota bacterium]